MGRNKGMFVHQQDCHSREDFHCLLSKRRHKKGIAMLATDKAIP